jgi:hypothetical protein
MAVSRHDATHINAELAHHVAGRNCCHFAAPIVDVVTAALACGWLS